MLFKEYAQTAVIIQCNPEITLFQLKKWPLFCFFIHFSYLRARFVPVINNQHDIAYSLSAGISGQPALSSTEQITTIISITTR
jgi:hypothetical protein